ncbi:hypothetical protein A2X44_02345 [candidate division CPR3 bacterium GWF2_35_18]|uniref:Phosphodiester glycosidase domain-containing protein n=1 Tax=candidate division CPR3 bacterium GW2011_GWF2_35_18 TaxID=1618350 RepID=A0A0G0ERP6_UNCC3|nr:MAG: hypothetical protein UR67_C0002G0152 [candidate division CPR3 bacterium GW2011_GWF2_35_18]KKP86594.1 MAG: hypothetical protein UR87_C0015G0005 [candidate division CPR3 bacterium GW2011_GWE2_35_7]OGB62835.1 MAG: hypothetical protein A2X44_02345 [candidate division CPR3 bacterium GWF2_35_18]OGB65416.1 MAG: hypothetical protein A2250_00560 [candidate division CPR3 bacterium RIFOXYA2_FULL_35_13]OGB79528.1 MAG: hypothetical protein A2296_00345 [candidate division CPR3 bacterium RIFOXYB2_FULL
MSKLLIPIIFVTLVLGVLWFFVFPGKDQEIFDWLKDKESSIFSDGILQNIKQNGYELKEYEFVSSQTDKKWRLTLIKFNPQNFNFKLLLNFDQSFAISDISEENSCTIAVNGIFYDKNFQPLGLIVSNGEIINSPHTGELGSGVFYVSSQNKAGIVSFSDYIVEDDKIAFQSGPIILKPDGASEILSTSKGIDARSIIAIDELNNVYLGVVYPKTDKNLVGASLYELAQVFQNSEEKLGVKMKSVLNLDGGSSTGLFTEDFYLAEKNLPENVICLIKK